MTIVTNNHARQQQNVFECFSFMLALRGARCRVTNPSKWLEADILQQAYLRSGRKNRGKAESLGGKAGDGSVDAKGDW